MPSQPRAVTAPRDASVVAGIAARTGSVAAAARAIGVSRGSLDGIISGRHGMGDKVHGKVETYLRSLPAADAKFAKDLGRALAYTSSGQPQRLRAEIQRVKGYDPTSQRKEISFFVRRTEEASGRRTGTRGRSGGGGGGGSFGGGGGGGSPGDESSDEEWYAEYGAWVEEVEAWRGDVGDLPDVEELPF